MRIAQTPEQPADPDLPQMAVAAVTAPESLRSQSSRFVACLLTALHWVSRQSVARLFAVTRFLEQENHELRERIAALIVQSEREREDWRAERRELLERLLGPAQTAPPAEEPEEWQHPLRRAYEKAKLRTEIDSLRQEIVRLRQGRPASAGA